MTTFYIEQFGCRATQADGAALERQLRERGCTATEQRDRADVVVINTCTVTAAADAQARESIRRIHAQNPAARMIVTGCYAQRAPEELAGLPGVWWVVGNSHKPEIPELISTEFACCTSADTSFVSLHVLQSELTTDLNLGRQQQNLPHEKVWPVNAARILVGDIGQRSKFLFAPVLGGEGNHTRPTLKIQDGCNSRCSYCVIPFVRGRSRSLPPDQVVEQVKQLVAPPNDNKAEPMEASNDGCAIGAREIVLSGINLGTYGRDLSPRVELIDLLRRILDETSLERLRISSIEPLDVTEDLIALFTSTDRIAQHFHMPLQSGSNRILAAMHRWYRAEHYARRVELIREQLPHAAIGADVIAGFPGETEEDHQATCAFIERLPFTYLHVFSFSSRPGTQAAELSNHLPAGLVKRRARELRALGEAKATAFRRSQAGRTVRVLTLHRDDRDLVANSTPALSSNYLRIAVLGKQPANLWFDVKFEAT